MLSPHDEANIGRILGGYGDWFSAHLLRLIMKADSGNKERIRQVFPDHVAAYENYINTPEPDWDVAVTQYRNDTE